jgi:hypothetical protein
MKTEIRALRPGDMASFVELCESRPQLSRLEAERRASIVEWVAFHNPVDDGNPTYFVGVQGDKVMAHLGRMPTLFTVRGDLETASYFHDLYVHPDLRKEQAQGFFLTMKLYRQAEKASQGFCAMVWTNEINIALQKARKYKQMWTDRRVMVLGVSQKVNRSVPGLLRTPTSTALRGLITTTNWANGLRLNVKAKAEQFDRFDERFDDLAERTAASIGIAPYKSHEYLNWKYVNRPGLGASRFQVFDESGRLAGYCVVVHPDSTLTASIAELVVVDNDPAGIHALLHRAISHLRELGSDRIEAVASDGPYARALHERIFRRDARIPLFIAKAERSPNAAYLQRASNWHLGLGDSEGPF